MSFGIIEVITLLLGLAGFGVAPNPNAPTADQALIYAMPDADLTAHVDATSFIQGNYKLLGQLTDLPQIKASPELQQPVRKLVNEIEGARSVAKLATDIDFATDVAGATAFVRFVPKDRPAFVIVVRGKFSQANIDRIAASTQRSAQKLGTGTFIDGAGTDPALALTRDNALLIGTPALVRARLAATWKAPSHAAGSSLAHVAEVIDARPVFALVLAMSASARREALAHLGPRNFASDIVARHKALSLSLYADGIGWTWIDGSRAGLDAMELVSNGAIELLRAAQIAPRGLAKIAMGAIDSYKGTSPQLDDMIKRKADILKIIDTYTGDGTFKVALAKDPSKLRLTVRATGKSISEVLPVGLVIPGALYGYLAFASPTVERELPPAAVKPATPVKPAPTAPAKRP